MKYVDYLGATVNIVDHTGDLASGMVMGVSNDELTLQRYRIPTGVELDRELRLGADFHLALSSEQRIAVTEIASIERIPVALILPKEFPASKIDRLGENLKAGDISPETLRQLDTWRRGFRPVYRLVVSMLDESFAYKASGRPGKTTGAIREKLNRESIRLSQMQDIAGCRIVVDDIAAQDKAVESITSLFTDCIMYDRREKPSHGYRAVHVVARIEGRPIEIQVRTVLQHTWAELSQKLTDVVDKRIKYGEGHPQSLNLLGRLSRLGTSVEMGGSETTDQRNEVIEIMQDFRRIAFVFAGSG